ncbi:uncharacterized protein LOC114354578 [Ostrinia furnacalis]|uniref:uncharacterized protein LOC114354578 n=1 Tax=Ostrinia furnacalis TaxID=93504 RepID=UPI00103FBAF5|nr:uncharacterized protein LOC114354578 [Ostrinia furnacalis]
MEFKVSLIFPVLLICLVHIASSFPKPKESNLAKHDEIVEINDTVIKKIQDTLALETAKVNEKAISDIPGRVRCHNASEDPMDDEDCQRHCIPKGYTYGLCFNNVCSCA